MLNLLNIEHTVPDVSTYRLNRDSLQPIHQSKEMERLKTLGNKPDRSCE